MHELAQRMLDAGQPCKSCRRPAKHVTVQRVGVYWFIFFWCARCYAKVR